MGHWLTAPYSVDSLQLGPIPNLSMLVVSSHIFVDWDCFGSTKTIFCFHLSGSCNWFITSRRWCLKICEEVKHGIEFLPLLSHVTISVAISGIYGSERLQQGWILFPSEFLLLIFIIQILVSCWLLQLSATFDCENTNPLYNHLALWSKVPTIIVYNTGLWSIIWFHWC